jgi:uncharacterized protein YutE (UPF0331/DUF86 family)
MEIGKPITQTSLVADQNLILIKTDRIKEYLGHLHDLSQFSLIEFKSNPLVFGPAELFLQLTIESAIDIGNNLISGLKLRKPASNREIFEILHENKIIGDPLRDSLCNITQFRNTLVHDYLRLERESVFNILQRDLVNLEEFMKATCNSFD